MKPKMFSILLAIFKVWAGIVLAVIGWATVRFLLPYFVEYWIVMLVVTVLFGLLLLFGYRTLNEQYYNE